MKYGLVSISFRSLSCEEIIKITKASGLDCIEWGGDVHVPPDNAENAARVASLTKEAGLTVSAYGSYYKAGTYGDDYKEIFGKILDTAVILGAPIIRIWAGTEASGTISEEKRAKITAECAAIARMAAEKNITVAFECHRNTLTDDYTSSLRLMGETAQSNLKMFWQPNETRDHTYNLKAAEELLPFITNVHVFNWPRPDCREPLADGAENWKKYLSVIARDGGQHCCCLEFMPDDKPETLAREAAVLKNILKNNK